MPRILPASSLDIRSIHKTGAETVRGNPQEFFLFGELHYIFDITCASADDSVHRLTLHRVCHLQPYPLFHSTLVGVKKSTCLFEMIFKVVNLATYIQIFCIVSCKRAFSSWSQFSEIVSPLD